MAEYIEREAVREAMLPLAKGNPVLWSNLKRAISAIPAVDVVPVLRGQWIEREDMYYGWNVWECSACREEFCVEEGTPKDNEYNYCPNCGAVMSYSKECVVR